MLMCFGNTKHNGPTLSTYPFISSWNFYSNLDTYMI